MPRRPTGSAPPGLLMRNVPLADFANLISVDRQLLAGSIWPLLPGEAIVGAAIDVLTPVYRGTGEAPSVTEPQGWTRELGTPRSNAGVTQDLFRVAAVWLDVAVWCFRECSVLLEWIYGWDPAGNTPIIGGSYPWLPVIGTAPPGLDLVPVTQLLQGIRIPSPYFRWTFTNEGAVNINENEALLHMWLRSE